MLKRHAGLTAPLALGAALLTCGGAWAQAPTTPAPATPAATLNNMDQVFMLRSVQGDMAEVMTSQMALKKSKDAGVKQVAQRLITDHGQSLKEGMGLATTLGLTPPKDPGVTNKAVAQMLMGSGGKDFDKRYMAAQTEAHENTIALYAMELSQGQDPQVKAFAAKYLPGVESHTVQIYQVAQSVGAPDSQLRPSTPPTVPSVPPAPMGDMSGTTPAPAAGAAGGNGGS